MAKLSILAGATSQSVNIFIQNNSVTTGAGLTGLAYNTASLIAYYTFSGANTTATIISLATLAAVNSTYSSGGFKEIDATHMPGLYRLDIPNAALAASNGQSVVIMLSGAANMAPVLLEIELTAINNQSTGFGLVNASANTVQINGISTSSVTTVNANIGSTQPLNFIGTGASAGIQIASNRKKAVTATFEFLLQSSATGAPKTGATVAMVISKDGGVAASTTNSVTEIGLGQYQIVLTAAEMTANNIFLQGTATAALTFNMAIQTQP